MTADELDAIRKRLAAITPGEWIYSRGFLKHYIDCGNDYRLALQELSPIDAHETDAAANAAFIAHAPADLRALLDQHDADQEAINVLRANILKHLETEQAQQERIAALEALLTDALPIIVENSSDDYKCDLCGAMLCHGESHGPDCLIARLEALKGAPDHD